MIRLIVLPKPKPPIKTIFERLAVYHKEGIKIPSRKSNAKPKYRPMMALNILMRSMLLTFKPIISVQKLSGCSP